MIFVNRDDVPCPEALKPGEPEKQSRVGARELEKITQMIADGKTVKSSDFKAYGRADVREALRELFHGKCAYCESPIAGNQDTDVEHYRPKKGVSEADEAGVDHPGYWWLGMVWENLLSSCQHCNQTRKHHVIIPDDIETVAEFEEFLTDPQTQSAGKLNAFPVANDQWGTAPGQEAGEDPLLINPCEMDPADHLEWRIFGDVSSVVAKNGSPAGEETREILGLNRRWLIEDRMARMALLQKDRNLIIASMNDWLEAETDEGKELAGKAVDRAIDAILVYTEEDQPFRALAGAFIERLQDEVIAMEEAANT